MRLTAAFNELLRYGGVHTGTIGGRRYELTVVFVFGSLTRTSQIFPLARRAFVTDRYKRIRRATIDTPNAAAVDTARSTTVARIDPGKRRRPEFRDVYW